MTDFMRSHVNASPDGFQQAPLERLQDWSSRRVLISLGIGVSSTNATIDVAFSQCRELGTMACECMSAFLAGPIGFV